MGICCNLQWFEFDRSQGRVNSLGFSMGEIKAVTAYIKVVHRVSTLSLGNLFQTVTIISHFFTSIISPMSPQILVALLKVIFFEKIYTSSKENMNQCM